MATIAMPNYTKKAAEQIVQQNAKPTAQQTINTQNKESQPPENATMTAQANGQARAMTQSAPAVNTPSGVMARQQAPTMDSLVGSRVTANNAGIQNVGWNDSTKSVTFDGKDYIKPAKISDDGTAYTDKQTIHNAINQYYSDKGTPLAGADSYVSGQLGVKGAVSWSDGNLMVGGQIVPTVYVDDNGTAYARQSDLDNAINNYRKTSGITGNQGVVDDWRSKYGGRIEDALDEVLNREKWSYDTESDPAYQAYKEAYTREGNRAYQNAYAQMAANTGGYGSSAGMTAAGQQMNYYMQQLGDRVPELMQNSYNRYLGEQELNRAALSSLMGVANDEYSKAYQANRDSISDADEANYQSWLRNTDARDYNRRVETEDRQWDYAKKLLQQQIEQGDLSTQAQRISNQMAAMQSVISRYMYNPNVPISAEDAASAGIPPKSDGSYPTAQELQENCARLEAAANLIGWRNYGLQELQDTLSTQMQYK